MRELNVNEINEVNGGRSIWYYAAFGVGAAIAWLDEAGSAAAVRRGREILEDEGALD